MVARVAVGPGASSGPGWPRLALFLINHHRSADVVKRALDDSSRGVLVTNVYAAYHAIDCRKQKCLVHLLAGARPSAQQGSRTSHRFGRIHVAHQLHPYAVEATRTV